MPRFKSTCPDLEHRDKIIVISFLGKQTFILAFVFTKNKNIKINKYTAPLSSDTGTYCF